MSYIDQKLLRIGVFYDGGFFYHVSNYYRYAHARRKRISIPGLHEFIRQHAATLEGVDVRYSQIVDSHFFRGRFSAQQTQAHDKLYAERAFNDVLMNQGVTTHYLPIPGKTEKGIDVWLSLEAFELAMYKRYNILVLIAGDSDFLPLVRKVNSLGARVMVLGWDFKYTDDLGRERTTITSIRLLNEVTYPVLMHNIIDDKTKRKDPLINNLFVETKPQLEPDTEARPVEPAAVTKPPQDAASAGKRYTGSVLRLNEGFGFIQCAEHPNNVFFHFSSLVNRDFADLHEGDKVKFFVVDGEKGPIAQNVEVSA